MKSGRLLHRHLCRLSEKRKGKPDDKIARKAVAEHLGISPDKLDDEQYVQALGEFEEQMKRNWEYMKNGRSLGEEDDIGDNEIKARREYAQLCETPHPAGYSHSEVALLQHCSEVIKKGGAVSVNDKHCQTILDTKLYKNKLFLLVRDPFNIENTVYKKDATGKVVSERTGFGSVIFKQGKSRRLSRFGKPPEDGSTGEDPFDEQILICCESGGCDKLRQTENSDYELWQLSRLSHTAYSFSRFIVSSIARLMKPFTLSPRDCANDWISSLWPFGTRTLISSVFSRIYLSAAFFWA